MLRTTIDGIFFGIHNGTMTGSSGRIVGERCLKVPQSVLNAAEVRLLYTGQVVQARGFRNWRAPKRDPQMPQAPIAGPCMDTPRKGPYFYGSLDEPMTIAATQHSSPDQCSNTYVCVCVCIHIYMRIHTYIHVLAYTYSIHIYIYTQICSVI